MNFNSATIEIFLSCNVWVKFGFKKTRVYLFYSLHSYVFAIFICFYAKKHSFRNFAITYVELRKKTARFSKRAVVAWKGNPTKVGSAYSTPLRQDELLSWCTYSDSIYLHNNRTHYVIYLAQVVGNVLRYLQCILNQQQSAYLVQYMIEIKKSLRENTCVTFL